MRKSGANKWFMRTVCAVLSVSILLLTVFVHGGFTAYGRIQTEPNADHDALPVDGDLIAQTEQAVSEASIVSASQLPELTAGDIESEQTENARTPIAYEVRMPKVLFMSRDAEQTENSVSDAEISLSGADMSATEISASSMQIEENAGFDSIENAVFGILSLDFEKIMSESDITSATDVSASDTSEAFLYPEVVNWLIFVGFGVEYTSEELDALSQDIMLHGEFESEEEFIEFAEAEMTVFENALEADAEAQEEEKSAMLYESLKSMTELITDDGACKDFRQLLPIIRTAKTYEKNDILQLRTVVTKMRSSSRLSETQLYEALSARLSGFYEYCEENSLTGDEANDYINQSMESAVAFYLARPKLMLAAAPNGGASINLSSYNSGGTIELTADTTATNQCQLQNGKTLTIDLKGHTLTMSNGSYFMLNGEKCVLNIKDSVGGGIVYASGKLVWGYNGGTFNLYSGTLDGSKATSKNQQGGCVELARNNMGANTFNMYGGTIQNFESTQYGGAVYVGSVFSGKKNTFNMYGGTIRNCNSPAGAAIYVDESGDGPGYLYIKGGKSENGEPKAVIKCDTFNGSPTKNAIYNYGYFGLEGVVDIDGIVYLNQNNWASTYRHFIKITDRLVVVGDGYIDVDTAYPNSNAICPGHTVVENATQTEGVGSTEISREEFYTYSSYFKNTTKGLMVSAGFDPSQNELDGKGANGGAPKNWPTNQGDKLSKKYSYIDVMGQELLIQAMDSPGDKRQMQNYDYLIYVERGDPSVPYQEFYSLKLIKEDFETLGLLNGAEFSLKKIADADGNPVDDTIGVSSETGDSSLGLDDGIAYIYLPTNDGKVMIDDGTYMLSETNAPEGYIARDEIVTIKIYHILKEDGGAPISVVEIRANNVVLATYSQEINPTYHDNGWLVEREINLEIKNTDEPLIEVEEPVEKIVVEKYSDSAYTVPLEGGKFVISDAADPTKIEASAVSKASGEAQMLTQSGSLFIPVKGTTYNFSETEAPEGYFLMGGVVQLADVDGTLMINGNALAEGETIVSSSQTMQPANGSWEATLSQKVLKFKVYDEKIPPTWSLNAVKYGSQAIDALRLADAVFTLYKDDNGDLTQIATAVSSDGTNGTQIGSIVFKDSLGEPVKLERSSVYVLREITAPLGYTPIKELTLTSNDDCSQVTVTQDGESYETSSYDADTFTLSISVLDETVYTMPSTGRFGMLSTLVIATAFMYLSALLWMKCFGKPKFLRKRGENTK